jgi:Protein of unknown function (DUF2971)
MTVNLARDLNNELWADFPAETSFPAKRPLLAHYTSVDVLEKIVKTNEVWFSNPLYMNDVEELEFGMNTGAQALRDSAHIEEATGEPAVHKKLISHFDRLFAEFDANHSLDTYVLCLSEHEVNNDDGLLSMWRGYGASGHGVAIVFDTSKLEAMQSSPLILGKVQYKSHIEREQLIEAKLEQLAGVLRSHPQTDGNLLAVARAWIEWLKHFSLFYKHNGFAEEREWRVVHMSERPGAEQLVEMHGYLITTRGVEPKLKLKLAALPGVMNASVSIETLADRIILGPSISTVLAANSVRKMLMLNKHASLAERVVESSIPFRS